MAGSDVALLGIQSCGCITLAIARPPDKLDREAQASVMKIINSGGRIERTTVAGARRRKNFLPGVCPHTPQGWKRPER